MPWFEIEFDYTGSAPTKSQTRDFCADDLGYGQDDVEAIGPIKVKILGASEESILERINSKLPLTRSKTTYTEAM